MDGPWFRGPSQPDFWPEKTLVDWMPNLFRTWASSDISPLFLLVCVLINIRDLTKDPGGIPLRLADAGGLLANTLHPPQVRIHKMALLPDHSEACCGESPVKSWRRLAKEAKRRVEPPLYMAAWAVFQREAIWDVTQAAAGTEVGWLQLLRVDKKKSYPKWTSFAMALGAKQWRHSTQNHDV